MPIHCTPTVRNPDTTDRFPDTTDRKSDGVFTIINLSTDDHEAQIAIRHPGGQVMVLTVKAHRGTLTVIGPEPVAVKVLEDSGEVAVSWRTGRPTVPAPPPPG